jgi:hypothetical protein
MCKCADMQMCGCFNSSVLLIFTQGSAINIFSYRQLCGYEKGNHLHICISAHLQITQVLLKTKVGRIQPAKRYQPIL